MILRSFIIIFIVLATSLFSQDLSEKLPMSDIEGGSICIVDGVNVITGNYSFMMEPFVVQGPQPVSYQCGCISDLLWKDNFETRVYFDNRFGECHYFQFGTAAYLTKCSDYFQDYEYRVEIKHENNIGLTNIGQGQISAKTSHRNILVTLPDMERSGYTTIYTGKGETKSFKRYRYPKDTFKADNFHLEREFKSNGTQIFYEMTKVPTGEKKCTWMRSADSHNQQDFASLQMIEFQENKPSVIEASDGRKLGIEYLKICDELLPKGIGHPHLPYHNFEYITDFGIRLYKIFQGQGRQTEIHYYGQNEFNADNGKENLVRGRVKTISKIIGGGLENCDLYNFEYKFKEINGKFDFKQFKMVYDYEGYETSVVDGLGYCRNFKYGKDLKVTEIEHRSQKKRLKQELFQWDKERLISKTLKDEHGRVVFCHKYTYDSLGNIIREDLMGRFSGSSDFLEHFFKENTYSKDKFNNLLGAYDGDITTIYVYKENTDLCEKEFITNSGDILFRKFRSYDNNSSLTMEIIDDGDSEDKNDLGGATQRSIKYFTPKKEAPCIGHPIEVKEVYIDLDTGTEKQLKRLVNEFTREGWLTKQEVYDSDDNYCYTLEWEYNRFGRVTREVNALGHVIFRDYDIYGNMIREEGPKSGQVTFYEYNFLDLPIRKEVQGEWGRSFVETYTYNQMGLMTLSKNMFEEQTVYKYDNFGRNIEKILPSAFQDLSIKQEFDCFGNVVQVTDPLGRVAKTTYNAYSQPVFISYPNGTKEKFTYNFNKTLKIHVDKSGTETHYDWDCLKRLTKKTIISSQGKVLSTETKSYRGASLLSETDAAGLVTNYAYDGAGRKIAVTAGDRLTTYEYDSLGRESVVKQWRNDESWVATVKIYDFCDQVIEEFREDSDNNIWGRIQTTYDEVGNKISVVLDTDGGLSITNIRYNIFNQPAKITDPLGHTTYINYNYEFYNENRQRVLQTTTIDPKGIQSVETYDVSERVVCVEKKDPFGKLLSKVDKFYDPVGNLIKLEQTVVTPEKDDRKVTALMEYNSVNLLTCLIEAAGSKEQRITRYEYTPFDEKETVIKPNGVILKYTYNTLGLVEKLESLNGSQENSICYEYTYDKLNNLVAVVDCIHNFVTEKQYNDHSEMIFEKLGNDLEIEYERDQLGRTVKMVFPGNRHVDYQYACDKLAKAAYIRNDEETARVSYAYGLSGKLKSTYLMGPEMIYRIGYEYDLKGQEISRDSLFWKQTDVQYDETGNLVSRDVIDYWGKKHCDYSYDQLNQLALEEGLASHTYTHDSLYNRVGYDEEEISVNDLNQVLFANGRSYVYDPSGNLVSDASAEYCYDALDRLITVTKNEEKYRYIYDSQNRRIAKEKYRETPNGWSLNTTIKFLYQDSCEVGSMEGSAVVSFRALGEGLGAEIGAAFAVEIEGEVYIPFYDQAGSIASLIDSKTNFPIYSARYSSFGQVEKSEGVTSPYSFSGKRFDPETSWIFFGRRYYDPSLGR